MSGRRTKLALGLMVLLLMLGFVLIGRIQPGTLTDALSSQFSRVSGLVISADAQTRPKVSVYLFPWPNVRMDDLDMQLPSQNLRISGGEMRANLRFLPLLVGRIEFSTLSFTHVRLELTITKGAANVVPVSGSLPVQTIMLHDSTAVIVTETGTAQFDAVEAKITPPQANRAAVVQASYEFDGKPGTVLARLDEPLQWQHGQASNVRVEITGLDSSLTFNGTAQNIGGLKLSGELKANLNPPASIFGRFGAHFDALKQISNISLQGILNADHSVASLMDMSAKIDGQRIEGDLSYRFAPRPILSATLAANEISLNSDEIANLRQRILNRATASDDPNYFTDLKCDLDLRASFGIAKIASIDAENVAVSVRTKPDFLEVSVDEANLYEGIGRGFFTLSRTQNVVTAHHKYSLAHLNLATLSRSLHVPLKISGNLSVALEAFSRDLEPAKIFAGWVGNGSLSVTDGEWTGGDLGKWFAIPAATPAPATGSSFPAGVTLFGQLQSTFNIDHGIIRFNDANIAGLNFNAAANGSIDLPRGNLDIHLSGNQISAEGDTTIAAEPSPDRLTAIEVHIAGPIQHPRIQP